MLAEEQAMGQQFFQEHFPDFTKLIVVITYFKGFYALLILLITVLKLPKTFLQGITPSLINFYKKYNKKLPLQNIIINIKMDTVQQRQLPLVVSEIPLIAHHSLPASSSPAESLEHRVLVQKIQQQQQKIKQEHDRHQSLQNTLLDLRTLLHATSNENEHYSKKLEEDNRVLSEHLKRVSAAVKAEYQGGAHLRKCALFWNNFV